MVLGLRCLTSHQFSGAIQRDACNGALLINSLTLLYPDWESKLPIFRSYWGGYRYIATLSRKQPMISRSPWRSAKPDEYASQAPRCLRTEVTDGPVVLNGNVFLRVFETAAGV